MLLTSIDELLGVSLSFLNSGGFSSCGVFVCFNSSHGIIPLRLLLIQDGAELVPVIMEEMESFPTFQSFFDCNPGQQSFLYPVYEKITQASSHTSRNFGFELLLRAEEVRHGLVKAIDKLAFADLGPVFEILDGVLTRQCTSRSYDAALENLARHCRLVYWTKARGKKLVRMGAVRVSWHPTA